MNNFCIYSRRTEADGAHFVEEEHILSAGLGGIQCLSKGMVSDEVNSYFSKLEMSFMRNSLPAVTRQFYGPGKRGSLNSKKTSKSHIHVYSTTDLSNNDNPEDVGLCYISLGEPYPIPTLRIKKGTFQILVQETADWEAFIKRLQNCPEDNYKNVNSDHIPPETVLLGYHLGEWHLAQGEGFELQTLLQCIQKLKTGKIDIINQQESAFHMNTHQILTYTQGDYYKVIAKYAFNFLAHCIGQSAILESMFDPLRDWILSETSDDNPDFQYITSVPESDSPPPVELPDLAHLLVIEKKSEHELIGTVYLYGGQLQHRVHLSANYEQKFAQKLYICDWKNRKESFL